MKTVRLTAAGAIVRFLRHQYTRRDGVERRLIEAVAGIFGHGNVTGLGQALAEHGGPDLPFVQPKSEQGMVHMAAAFAKERRRLSTLACTTSIGPGATNLVTGAAGATINRLPVLLLPGDVFAGRVPAPVLQQLEDARCADASVNDCLRPISRFWDRIQRPEQLLYALPEAMRVLACPVETGTVTLCLPQDVQCEAFDYPEELFEARVWDVPRPPCEEHAVSVAADLIRRAERPLIVAGGGVRYSEAEEALQALAEATGIPVALTQAGKGVLLDEHPQCLGAIGVTGTAAANTIARDADLVIAVGTRLSDFTTASRSLFHAAGTRWVCLQIDRRDAAKRGALPLVGDARVGLRQLLAGLSAFRVAHDHAGAIVQARAAWDGVWQQLVEWPGPHEGLVQAQVIHIVNEEAGPGAIIVHAAGGLPGDLHRLWRCRSRGDYHSEYGYSCMGYEIAGALGVKLARPDREVYAMLGDGSYLMLHSELVTSLQEDRKLIAVLIDNGGYQCIHHLQRGSGSAGFGNEFRRRAPESGSLTGPLLSIDYAANARSLGAAAFSADSPATLREALAAARAQDRSTLIHVRVQGSTPPTPAAWWDVPVAEVSSQPSVDSARRAYDQQRARRRIFP